ncbi:Ubiquitin-conjugating enzyme E2 Z [Talaromyces pinophilus]|nr:Ubiquitin-conjugating enzyme E2 Z [Talaromyces pinophilus]
MSHQSILRITRELSDLQKGKDLSLAITYDDSDIRNGKALIVGPRGTPYEFGFFEVSTSSLSNCGCTMYDNVLPRKFSVKFPGGTSMFYFTSDCAYCGTQDYPANPPKVTALTTNSGRCRFAPNIYANGKVCLYVYPIFTRIILVLQVDPRSLMSSNPYENEPGYEAPTNDPEKQRDMANYIAKESLNIAPGSKSIPASENTKTSEGDVAMEDDEEERESYQSFVDLRKRRFPWYYESYMHTIDVESEKVWTDEGLMAKKDDLGIASNLSLQYQQILEDFNERKYFSLDLSLVDGNPFTWDATYFGRPGTHLDGSVFNIMIHLSPRFPQEQPRVFFKTPIFHHHVSEDGMLCYHTDRPGEMKHHIQTIVRTTEEESPPFDPRTTVNLAATKLFWGTPNERKKYYRALRRLLRIVLYNLP